MKSGNNISMLFVTLLKLATVLSLSSCSTIFKKEEIPDVQVYKEIPFIDAREGVSIMSTSHTEKMHSAEEWERIAPYLLCVDDKGWADIKIGWLKACRFAGKDCNIMVESIDKVIRELDDTARRLFPLK